MASTSYVPTKAALHAIRGLLFTTSCSVVLLAEERRRRIKVARNVLENARKIHTAKSHRSAAAALGGEAIGSWEYRLHEDQEIIHALHRRRRQSIDQMEGRKLKGRASGADLPESSGADIEPMLRAASEAVLRKAVGIGSLSLHNSPSSSPKFDNTHDNNISKIKPLSSLNHKAQEPMPKRSYAALEKRLQALAIDLSRAANAPIDPDKPATDVVQNARLYLLATPNTKTNAAISDFKDGQAILSQLVASLHKEEHDQDIPQGRFDLALGVLQRLSRSKVPRVTAKSQLEPVCLALLQQAVMKHPDELASVYDSISKIFGHFNVFYPFISWLRCSKRYESMESFLHFLAGPDSPAPWTPDLFMLQYLKRYFSQGRKYTQLQNLYCFMDSAQWFHRFGVPPSSECRIRAFVAREATNAGDTDFAAEVIDRLRVLFPQYLEKNVELQAPVVLQLALRRQWDKAAAAIQRLAKIHGEGAGGLKDLVAKATDIAAAKSSAEDLVAWVQNVVVPLGPKFSHKQTKPDAAEATTYTQLLKLADEEKWWELTQIFAGLSDQGWIPSHRCLRLGVIGQLKADGGRTDAAAALVSDAYVKGVDVTDAVSHVQLAQIERGLAGDVKEVISTALQHGVKIYDIVYNMASKRLSQLGSFSEAVDVCEVAGRENGNGDVLYSEYNFANLVFAYIGAVRYRQLTEMLDLFSAGTTDWHGSRVCKECLKLAMKTVAMRVLAADSSSESSEHQRALDKLDAALQHVLKRRAEHLEWRSSVNVAVWMNPDRASRWPSASSKKAAQDTDYSSPRRDALEDEMRAARRV